LKACIIAVGGELLTPFRVDTNSLLLTDRLNQVGAGVRLKSVVGDDVDDVAAALGAALEWADVVVVTGGLGPTEDDVTREAVARVLGAPLEMHEAVLEGIRERFRSLNLPMPGINRRQALVPAGATLIENASGTAPGFWIERGHALLVVLPGPPGEMAPMFEAVARERLAPKTAGARLFRRVLKITGRSESDVDACAQPVYAQWASQPVPIATTILASFGQIELHLTARATSQSEADEALDVAVDRLRAVLGDSVFSVDGRSLEAVVGDLLRVKGLKLAVAESCTGGALASRLTDVPGSSDYLERGVVCYSNRSKVEMLGVPRRLIDDHGAVSEPVAAAMAEGIRTRAGTETGIAITGIAGPGGGTPGKPVGTVVIAVVCGAGSQTRMFRFPGGREQVRSRSVQAALNMLRLMLLAP
jgi:nicotinamide-nucleotide amidase